MDRAKIVAEGSPRELISRYTTREVVELRFRDTEQASADGKFEGIGARVEVLPDRVLLYADEGDAAVTALHHRGLKPAGVLVRRATLEDVFLQLTGHSLSE
jgi:lipooligosaccharide transport system ATP-binding protein